MRIFIYTSIFIISNNFSVVSITTEDLIPASARRPVKVFLFCWNSNIHSGNSVILIKWRNRPTTIALFCISWPLEAKSLQKKNWFELNDSKTNSCWTDQCFWKTLRFGEALVLCYFFSSFIFQQYIKTFELTILVERADMLELRPCLESRSFGHRVFWKKCRVCQALTVLKRVILVLVTMKNFPPKGRWLTEEVSKMKIILNTMRHTKALPNCLNFHVDKLLRADVTKSFRWKT